MTEHVHHPVLSRPHEYDLTDFRFHLNKENHSRSFIDMTLEKDQETVTLRFWQPTGLKIEEGFPRSTRGMVFYDLTGQHLEDISIEVADFEASWGAITFFARDVIRI